MSQRALRLAGHLPWRLSGIEPEPALFQRDTCGRKLLGGETRADDAGSQRAPAEFGGQRQHAERKATCAITSVVHVAPSRRLVRPESAPAPEPREATRGLERGHEAGHGGPGHGHRAAGSGPSDLALQRESSPGASRTPSRFALGWAGHRFARLGGPS